MKQKSILLITSEFPPLPGGIGTHACQLSLALVSRSYNIQLITDFRSCDIQDDLNFDATLPFTVSRIKRFKFIWISYMFRFIKVLQVLFQKKSDIVITSGKFSLWIGGFYSLFFKKTKWICVVHGSEILAGGFISKIFTRWALRNHETIITVSKFTFDELYKACRIEADVVINNGVSIPDYKVNARDFLVEPLRLITVGNLSERKGQLNIIKILPELLKVYPNLEYHLVGIPTQIEKFIETATELKVENHLIVHGMVTEEVKNELLQQSHIFMMLSEHLVNGDFEGFGIAVIEANAFGLPAIGSKNSGIADAIGHGQSGLLVDSQQPMDIIFAIKTIAEDYKNFSGNAIDWSQKFDWGTIVNQYIHTIDN